MYIAFPITSFMKLIPKRYIFIILLLALFGTCQMEFLQFRKSEEEQTKFLNENGADSIYFGTIRVGERNIHYMHVGAESLPLILFVHGSPGSSADMLGYLAGEALRPFQKIALDRPGFGYSDFGIAEPSLAAQAAAVAALLKAYPARPAVLLGHSYGGPVIARVAMDYPGLVDGLVIVAGALDPDLEPHYWWQKPLNWPIVRSLLPPAFRVSNQEILQLRYELDSMTSKWGKVSCAVAMLQGLKDKLVHPDNYIFAKNKLVNSRCLAIDTLSNDGHFILWTKEKRISDQILEMMSELSGIYRQ